VSFTLGDKLAVISTSGKHSQEYQEHRTIKSKSSYFYTILHLVTRYKADDYSSVGTYIHT
jgi:hypothetical protein